MVRTPLCTSLHFCIYFLSLFGYSGHLCTIGACDHYATTREALAFHARTCPGLPGNQKRQLCDEFIDTTPPPKKRKSSSYSFLYLFWQFHMTNHNLHFFINVNGMINGLSNQASLGSLYHVYHFSKFWAIYIKLIIFVTRGKQSDFCMYIECIGMVFYLTSSFRKIQRALVKLPVSELRLRCWKKMALNPSSSGMKSVSKQEQVAQNLTCQKWGQILTTKKRKSSAINTARNNRERLLLEKKSECTSTFRFQIFSRILFHSCFETS